MRAERTTATTALIASAAALLVGCGDDGLGRRPVSGAVTLDGRPLEQGVLLFEPIGEPGTAVGASVEDGRFAIARRDGPSPGAYKIRIHASAGTQADPAPGGSIRSRRPMIERIPARYNVETGLEVRVTADGPNAFEFPLRSDPDDDPNPGNPST